MIFLFSLPKYKVLVFPPAILAVTFFVESSNIAFISGKI
jgi:hypothetical protein